MNHTLLKTTILLAISTMSFGQITTSNDSLLLKIHAVKLIPENLEKLDSLRIKGGVYSTSFKDGDTIIMAEIAGVNVSSPRLFKSHSEYLKYQKYKRYASLVYPYAKQAVRIFREAEYVSENMKKRKRRRYLKKLAKELEKEFEQPLGKLSKTQGKILIKMIERELDTPMYDLIKTTRGKMKAFYWNHFSKLYGYRLKNGYKKGENPILDIVLQDFDISHTIAKK